MPSVDSSAFYAIATARWASANFAAVNLSALDATTLKTFAYDRTCMSGDQAFFEGLDTVSGKPCHLSLPLQSFEQFHITIHDKTLTGVTKGHVYFQIDSWTVSLAGASTIRLSIIEKPKIDGKKTSAESIKFSKRNEVKADVERIAGVLFNGCKED